MSTRGMVKYAPYRSLIEQEDVLNAMRRGKARREKKSLSNDLANEINEVLCNHRNEEVELTYYKDGRSILLEGTVQKVDEVDHRILIQGRWISLSAIENLKRKQPSVFFDDCFHE